MENRYHFLYRTECKVTNKYYIGVHSTNNLNDGYLGSGKLLLHSVKKYGKKNHIIEILQFFDTKEQKFEAEKKYITLDMLNDPNCLNFSFGGNGGIMNESHFQNFMEAGRQAFKQKLKDPEFKKQFGKKTSDRNYRRIQKGEIFKFPDWTGKKHKEETKSKIGQTNSIKQSGERNSQFGTCWITDGKENKKVKNTDPMPSGWYKGRV